MTWVASSPASFAGQRVGTGHCVPFVQIAAGAPHTSRWRRGARVRGGEVATGAAIATFDAEGRYANRTDGASHAAILVAELPDGLRVWDQWVGQPVHQRTIRFRAGSGRPVNDGDQYFVILEALS